MRFQLLPDGTLRTPSQPGNCLTTGTLGTQAAFQACTPGAAAQQFTYSPATQRIASSGSAGGCLSIAASPGGTAVLGRPLADGSWAVGFFNAGPVPADVTCDSECLGGMGFEGSQTFAARDLWAQADLPPIAAGANITMAALEASGGVALIKLTPTFLAKVPEL